MLHMNRNTPKVEVVIDKRTFIVSIEKGKAVQIRERVPRRPKPLNHFLPATMTVPWWHGVHHPAVEKPNTLKARIIEAAFAEHRASSKGTGQLT